MRDETVCRVRDSRHHANPSSDRVFFRRRCNNLTFPWRAVAHYWGEGGNESHSEAKCLDATLTLPLRYSSLLGQCLRLVSYATGALPHLRLRAFHRRSSLPSLCYRIAGNSVAAL